VDTKDILTRVRDVKKVASKKRLERKQDLIIVPAMVIFHPAREIFPQSHAISKKHPGITGTMSKGKMQITAGEENSPPWVRMRKHPHRPTSTNPVVILKGPGHIRVNFRKTKKGRCPKPGPLNRRSRATVEIPGGTIPTGTKSNTLLLNLDLPRRGMKKGIHGSQGNNIQQSKSFDSSLISPRVMPHM